MPKADPVEVISADEAATLLGVSRRMIYKLAEQREIPHFRLGTSLRFERGTLVAWIRARLEESTALGPAAGRIADRLPRGSLASPPPLPPRKKREI